MLTWHPEHIGTESNATAQRRPLKNRCLFDDFMVSTFVDWLGSGERIVLQTIKSALSLQGFIGRSTKRLLGIAENLV